MTARGKIHMDTGKETAKEAAKEIIPKAQEKKKAKKRRSIPLRRQLFISLAVFCALILALLWVFQIVFLDDFYYNITLSEIRSAASDLLLIPEDDLAQTAQADAINHDLCVLVCDDSMTEIATADALYNCIIHHLGTQTLSQWYRSALENENGEYIIKHDSSATFRGELDFGKGDGTGAGIPADTGETVPDDVPALPDGSLPEAPADDRQDSKLKTVETVGRLIYVKTGVNSDGDHIVIFLDSALTPVNSITKTLTVQLAVISLILLICAFVLAFILSSGVSRPIHRIGYAAKRLAKGDYDTDFDGRGCRETEELSDTLNYAAGELSKVDKLRRELIANISHDLRTPLTMISGYTEVMRDIPGENTPENMQVVIDETKRLSSLVNELLETSRIESRRGELCRETFSISEALSVTCARFRKLAEHDGYTVELENTAGEAYVYADKTQMLQVLYNLIGNAVNHTGDDCRVTVRESLTAAGDVRIDVCDSGEGIPESELPKIWERYYRSRETHKRVATGSGLGLSIVRDVLTAHGARFGVRSDIGEGSDFWFEMKTEQEKK